MGASLMAAALALPGLMALAPHGAQAESAPDQTTVGVKYLHYEDWQQYDPAQPRQSGARMKANSPSAYWLAPVGSQLAVEGSVTLDSVSGASPKYHNTLSGASSKGYIDDRRKAIDIKATHFAGDASVGVGVAYSSEHDYTSKAVSANLRINSADNNRTYAMGASLAVDTINAVSAGVLDRHKRTWEFLAGVTQVLTPVDLAQVNVTYSSGRGYFSDPYKDQYGQDVRPNARDQLAVLARYNHQFENLDASLRTTARYYRDTFGVKALTVGAEWAQELTGGWTVTPSMRYGTQRAAFFYYDPPYPSGAGVQAYYSADTRLSAFGAVTAGVKVEKTVGKASRVDVKVERYEQRAAWHLSGPGSAGLLPLHALFWQVGWSTRY
ncbi:DUF3570 domain-containing protein [soil metagenome]